MAKLPPHLAEQIEELKRAYQPDGKSNGQAEVLTTLSTSLGDLLSMNIAMPEVLALDTPRGGIGIINAVVNAGKSTLLRNLALTLATGGSFGDVVRSSSPRRVLYVDGETPLAMLRSDLERMTLGMTSAERQIAAENLRIMADITMPDGTLFRLPTHLTEFHNEIALYQPDIVILDTLAALFEIWNENDAAEIGRKFIAPVRATARRFNCTVLVAHHIGKTSESELAEAAYRGRGSSAIAAGESVWLLTKDRNDESKCELQCVKRKVGDGTRYSVQLRLDQTSRWYVIQQTQQRHIPTNREIVYEAVRKLSASKPAQTGEIIALVSEHMSRRTCLQLLAALKADGLLDTPQRGHWSVREDEADKFDF
jgi:hypothetical protein